MAIRNYVVNAQHSFNNFKPVELSPHKVNLLVQHEIV